MRPFLDKSQLVLFRHAPNPNCLGLVSLVNEFEVGLGLVNEFEFGLGLVPNFPYSLGLVLFLIVK